MWEGCMKTYCSIVDLKFKNVFRMNGQIFAVVKGAEPNTFKFGGTPLRVGNGMKIDCVNDKGQRCQVVADTFDFVELIR
jgi:hypothetical protein